MNNNNHAHSCDPICYRENSGQQKMDWKIIRPLSSVHEYGY